jgi:hypothetical protein
MWGLVRRAQARTGQPYRSGILTEKDKSEGQQIDVKCSTTLEYHHYVDLAQI